MWDYDKNEDTPYDWTSSSRQKRWFKCENGHNDYKEIFRKVDVPTCFECYKEKLYQNDKLSIQQWDSLINKNKTNTKVLYERTITREKLIPYLVDEKDYYELIGKTSSSRIRFKCIKGHIKQDTISNMITCPSCLHCSKNKPVIDRSKNLLKDVRPELEEEYSKNNDKSFDELTYGSNYIAEWVCKKNNNHIWKRVVNKRGLVEKDVGCLRCKYESKLLMSRFPELKSQYCEDNECIFEELLAYDDRRVKWKCLENPEHTFYKKVKSMIFHRACHKCVDESHTSKDEQEIFKELKDMFPNNDLTNNDRDAIGGNFELDMYFKDLKIAIEYNGTYWHDTEKHPYMKDRHYRKQQECIYNGIMLIVIWEDDYINNQEQVLKELETMIKQKIVMEKYTYEAKNAI